jgi:DNA-binding MarR family transcriptional regulator
MFDHCLYFNTTALARRVEQEWSDAFAAFGLTAPQAFMLRAVLARPGLLQRELAAELAIAKSTATRALDFLEAKGFIERRSGQGDGREKSVFPTPAADSIRQALDEASGTVTSRLKKLLGTREFADTVTTIKSVRAALE